MSPCIVCIQLKKTFSNLTFFKILNKKFEMTNSDSPVFGLFVVPPQWSLIGISGYSVKKTTPTNHLPLCHGGGLVSLCIQRKNKVKVKRGLIIQWNQILCNGEIQQPSLLNHTRPCINFGNGVLLNRTYHTHHSGMIKQGTVIHPNTVFSFQGC